jgi:hypothetical protein
MRVRGSSAPGECWRGPNRVESLMRRQHRAECLSRPILEQLTPTSAIVPDATSRHTGGFLPIAGRTGRRSLAEHGFREKARVRRNYDSFRQMSPDQRRFRASLQDVRASTALTPPPRAAC